MFFGTQKKIKAAYAFVQILLVTEQGDVLEGTQTNFFAIIDNAVHTAKEGVLMGTVRGVLLEVSRSCVILMVTSVILVVAGAVLVVTGVACPSSQKPIRCAFNSALHANVPRH